VLGRYLILLITVGSMVLNKLESNNCRFQVFNKMHWFILNERASLEPAGYLSGHLTFSMKLRTVVVYLKNLGTCLILWCFFLKRHK
jgi:hypothetical protein